MVEITGHGEPFNYTEAMKAVVEDVVRTLPLFGHIDPARILVSYSWARRRTRWGTYAKTLGLSEISAVGGPLYQFRGRDVLYVLYFVLPRFQDVSFEEKILTILHELYHVSPSFDGTIRIVDLHNSAHGRSRSEFDERLRTWVDLYLEERGRESILDFLRMTSHELSRNHPRVIGLKVRLPLGYS